MAGMYGADVDQLRALARSFDTAANKLDHDRMSVGNAIRIQAWVGPVAVRFRAEWDSAHSMKVATAAARLRAAAAALKRNADDQERTSSADTGASGGRPGQAPSVSRWEKDHTASGEGPRNAQEFVSQLEGMQTGEDGVRIQKIVGPDGVARFVVYINGSGSTSDGDWGGVLGWQNNPSAAASFDSRTLDHIRRKISSAIDDPNAEVAFVGFSQGGMIAQRLADESSFNCRALLTYGSPVVQSVRNYGGADVIRLEHNADIVPRLGLQNPVHDLVTGIMDSVTGNTPPEKGEDVVFRSGGPKWGGAHTHGDYRWVAEQFEKSGDDRHRAAKESLHKFTGRIVADER